MVQIVTKPLLAEKIVETFDLHGHVMVMTVSNKLYTLGVRAEVKPAAVAAPAKPYNKPGPKGPRPMKPSIATPETDARLRQQGYQQEDRTLSDEQPAPGVPINGAGESLSIA